MRGARIRLRQPATVAGPDGPLVDDVVQTGDGGGVQERFDQLSGVEGGELGADHEVEGPDLRVRVRVRQLSPHPGGVVRVVTRHVGLMGKIPDPENGHAGPDRQRILAKTVHVQGTVRYRHVLRMSYRASPCPG